MKKRSSLKYANNPKNKGKCKIIKRKGVLRVISDDPRLKGKQG